jgi:hypothetical protein
MLQTETNWITLSCKYSCIDLDLHVRLAFRFLLKFPNIVSFKLTRRCRSDWDIYKLNDLAPPYQEVQDTLVTSQLKDTMPDWLQSEESEDSDEVRDPNQKDLGVTTKAQCQIYDNPANKKKDDANNDEDCIAPYTDSESLVVDISKESDLIAREK